MRLAGLELGGTKVVVALSDAQSRDILGQPIVIPTTEPQATVTAALRALETLEQRFGKAERLGIASFGPIGVTPGTPDYGRFYDTPKPGWSGFDLVSAILAERPSLHIALDTDVNGAALGEARWDPEADSDSLAYVTVGTGIGVGLLIHGRPVHGLMHPEAGHIRVQRHPDDPYQGHCPFHGDCLEGLACGPAIAARTGQPGEALAADHPVWDLTGYYLGQLFSNLLLTLAVRSIRVGGGVGLHPAVLKAARASTFEHLKGYLAPARSLESISKIISPATLGDRAGLLGAIALADH
ncbi:MAG: ROK family protein [Asticcacaulis sp.]